MIRRAAEHTANLRATVRHGTHDGIPVVLVSSLILTDSADTIDDLQRQVTELTAALQTSLEFNERAHVLLGSIKRIMDDVTFEPDDGLGIAEPTRRLDDPMALGRSEGYR